MAVATKDIADLEAALGQGELWAEMRQAVEDKLGPLFKRALLIGAALGAQEKPASVKRRRRKTLEILASKADMGLAEEARWLTDTADNFVRLYLDRWWVTIEATARDTLRDSIFRAVTTGGGSPQVAADLEGIFGRRRAETIAVTEVTRLMGQGAQLQYQRAGYDLWEWRTANDARVDPICQSKAGSGPYPISEAFAPAHPRCRCWPVPTGAPKPRQVPTSAGELPPVAPGEIPIAGAYPKGGFRDHVAAEAWARARFPKIERWTLSDIELSNLNDALEQLDVLQRRFPEPFANLRAFGTHPGKVGGFSSSSTWAHAYRDGTQISLNPKWWGERGSFVRNIENSAKPVETLKYNPKTGAMTAKQTAGWHPKAANNVQSVITHEFGHILDGYYSGGSANVVGGLSTRGLAFRKYVSADGTGLVQETFARVKGTRAVNLSDYAKTNEHERFAEGFADMIHTPKRQWNTYTKRVAAYLDEVGSRDSWLDKGEWEWLSDLPNGDQRHTEGEALQALRKKLGYD